MGKNCRIYGLPHAVFGSDPWLVTLGDHVSVTSGVRFVTHDGGVWVLRHKHPGIDVHGRITVGSNVFIGVNTVILPGTVIGDNVVIGACSLVKGVIPSNCVAAGVPAKVIKSIDDYEKDVLARGSSFKGTSGIARQRAIEAHLDKMMQEEQP